MKKVLTMILCVALLYSVTGCSKAEKEYSDTGYYFNTIIKISVNHSEGEALLTKCFSLCADYEKIFSRTDEDSELYKLNHRNTDSVKVSDELAELIALGLEYGQISGGVFDITVAPLSDLWDFTAEEPKVPADADIQKALEKVDDSKVHVEGNTITFDSPDTMIDLGAIVKGWAADQLKSSLVKAGVTSGMIDLGGNVLAIGTHPDGSPWKVGIQKPFAQRNETLTGVETIDKSVVSSGTYERFFEQDGKHYHHILDPRTGYPVETDLSQVTIISEQSVLGDLYSTICMLEGYEAASKLVDSTSGLEAIYVSKDGKLL